MTQGSDDTSGMAGPAIDPAVARQRERARPASTPHAVRLAEAMRRMPANCPYRPVGFEGNVCYVIDVNHQLRGLRPSDLTRNELVSICGAAWLRRSFPRLRKGVVVNGFAVDEAADTLTEACHAMGYFNPRTWIRGRGAWRGEDGDLILHRGDHLIVGGRILPPGQHDEFVYPRRPPLPPMTSKPEKPGPTSAAAELMARLDTFAWSRGTLDSWLMLGWIGVAIIGGALEFRPHAAATGEFGFGKTTLQRLLLAVMGQDGIISVSNASAAGLWQAFNNETLPAAIDELEAGEDPRKLREILKLIRDATSGGRVMRGGADHHGAEFTVASAFFCSAIIMPPMASEDLSRFHIFNLLAPVHGARVPPFSTDMLGSIGERLLRRLVDHYRRLMGEVLPRFKAALADRGFPNRAVDLYGILFACADVLLHDTINMEQFDRWCDHRFMTEIRSNVTLDQTAEWQRCFDHLATSRIEPYRAESELIAELIWRVAILSTRRGEQRALLEGSGELAKPEARLAAIGLRVIWKDDRTYLCFANAHQGLAAIFRETRWQTTANAAGGGGWSQAMARAPEAKKHPGTIRFGRSVSRCVMVPLEHLMPDDGHASGSDFAGQWAAAEN